MSRLALILLATLASMQEASAYTTRRAAAMPLVRAVPEGPEGVGCYWERGRQFCSRYCYIEVDGRRFCRHRAREAHSQAPRDDFVPFVPTMK